MSKYLGKTIRAYTLNQEIGSGGFGTVFKAKHEVLGRDVAAKVIKDKFVNEPQFVRQFESEARIIAGLEHANIVPLYDFFRDPSGALLVMRWLSGGSLRQQLKKGRMTIPQIVQTFNQIVKALAFAHRHNVIHRDIKPENILLDEERNAFLTDFGIAVDMRNQDEQNIENISFGSPDYVAPEQLGKNKTLTHHSDIYSLGIMLYELLAHQRPFVSKDPKEIIRMQMYHPVPSLRLARPDLPAEIDTIIWSATAKNPSMRYDTVIKFAQAFQRIAQRIEYIRPDYLIPMPEDTIEPVSNQNNIYLDNPTDSKTEVFATGSLNTEQFDVMPVGISDSTDDLDDAGTPALGLDGTPSLFDSPDIDNTENLDTIVDMLVPDVEDAFDAEMTADLSGGFEAGDAGTINLNANGFRVANFYSAVPSNPYKGLRAFGEGDTDQFFGREALVKSILEELADDNRRFMALIGRSGSGKSSVVRAGVIPALKRDAVPLASKWFYSTMVPSDDPYREISDALLGVAIFAPDNWSTLLRSTPDGLHALIQQMLPDDGSEVFLFIDQFEELFTLTQDENIRNDFLTSLAYAVSQPDSRLRLMLTMRADFFGYPLEYEAFAGMFSKHNEAVPPLSREQLRSTIVEPARLAGIIIEDMLVNALLDAVEEQPGALPLLQYTLTEMVNELIAGADVTSGVSARRMTFSKYESMGGIAGALVQRANAIYDKLTPEAQDIARLLFLSIVTVAEGKPTSRTTIWTDLQVDDRDLLERIIEAFSKYRLLSTDQDPVTRAPTVEVAHEALIQEWGLFKDWIEANNESLRIRYELEVERSRWLSYDKDTSFLATGLQLAQFESLLTDDFVTLGKDEREYIIASRDEEDRELRDIRNRNQLLQIISTGFAIASIFAFGLVFLSINLRDDAISAQNRAENNLLIARSRGLASSAIANLDQNDLALLLSTEAYQLDNTYESINSLLLALQANPLLDTYLHGHVGGVRAVAFDNSGDYAVSVDTRRTILRWDLTTNTPIGDSLSGHGGEILDVAISSQNIIASASIDGTVRLWDFETGEELAVLEHPREVYSLAFSPDGAQLASSYGVTDASGTILVWDIETNEIIETIDNAHDDVIASLDYNNDGSQLASAGRDSMVKLWDTADYSLAYTLEGHGDGVNALDFDPLGNALASTGNDRAIIIWNPRTGRQIGVLPRSGHTGDVLDIAYDATGTLLATGSADSTIIIFDLLQDFAPISTINTHNRNVHSVAFSPIAEDTRLLSGSDDSTVVVSTVQSITRPITRIYGHNLQVQDMVATDDLIAVAGLSADSTVDTLQIIDRETGDILTNINLNTVFEVDDDDGLRVTDLARNTDGTRIALALSNGQVGVWDVEQDRLAWFNSNSTNTIRAVTFASDDTRVVSASDSGVLAVWDAMNGNSITDDLLPETTMSMTALAISPDGATLAIGFRDGTLVLWDTITNSPRFDAITAHISVVEALVFDNESQHIYTASRDNTISQWDLTTGDFIQSMQEHGDWVVSLSVSPDGNRLASGDRQGFVRLWDVSTGNAVGDAIPTLQGFIQSVQFVDDQTIFASNESAGITTVIDINVDTWLNDACTTANRSLSETEWGQFFPDQAYAPYCDAPVDTAQTP